MKKLTIRKLSFLLAVILLFSGLSTVLADDTGICFVSTNDKLLELNYMPYFVGGSAFLSYDVFAAFGIYYSYFEADNTALLYTNSKQIFFNLTTGQSYDSFFNYYAASAVMKSGVVYVPAAWVCQYFGLTYSYIAGNGNGDVVRITNGAAVLNDGEFLKAAASLMRSRYSEYFGVAEPAKPSPDTNTENDDRRNTRVSLCFIGLPSDEALDLFAGYGYTACFFLTAEDIMSNPDKVRRIFGSGHSLGVYCTSEPENSYEAGLDAFFAVCQYRPLFVSSSSSAAETVKKQASDNALLYFTSQLAISADESSSSAVMNSINKYDGNLTVSFTMGEKSEKLIPNLLQALSLKKYSVTALRETYIKQN